MPTLSTDAEAPHPDIVAHARRVLAGGGLVIYPTDTLYALGGWALDAGAVARVRRAKGRPDGKALPVIAESLAQVRRLARLNPTAERLASRLWPGPITFVLPARPGLPEELVAGGRTLAVRVPAAPLARALCGDGPLVATSANRSGESPPGTCAEAVAAVGAAAALAIDAGPGRRVASTIVDLTDSEPSLRRAGAVAWEDVVAAFRSGAA